MNDEDINLVELASHHADALRTKLHHISSSNNPLLGEMALNMLGDIKVICNKLDRIAYLLKTHED